MHKAIRLLSLALSLLCVAAPVSAKYAGEYYWNHDPGIGSANKIAAYDIGADGTVDLDFDVSGIKPGVNILGIRVFNGRWSPTTTTMVFVADTSTPTQGVCEYWWDTDPGYGQGHKLTFDTDGNSITELEMTSSGVTPGIHTLGMRTYINGRWSPTTTILVFVADTSTPTQGVCEYWWDTDPGYGQGHKLTFDTDGNSITELELDAKGLPFGLHTLGMRTYISGRWSPSTITPVFIQASDVKVDYIEYFWGIDPGCGKGTRIEVNSQDEIVLLDDIDIDLPTGAINDYVLGMRPHTTTGHWGPCYYEVYSLGESVSVTLDINEVTIDGIGDIQQLTATVDSDDPTWPRPVTWTSSDENVAKVDATGLVRAVGKGECVVRAECVGCGAYDECSVKVTASRVLLIDTVTYDNTEDQPEMNITYRRTFDTTVWQPLYLPYSISYDEWAEYADVAEVACVHMFDDGRTVIEFVTVKSGELQPHMPYMIKPRGKGTVEFESRERTLYGVPTVDNPIMCCTPRWAYTFHGVYQQKDDLEGTGAYVLNDECKFVHTTEPLAPNRFYMLRNRTNQGYWPSSRNIDDDAEIYIMVDGELIDASAVLIGDVNTDGTVTVSDIVSIVSYLLGSPTSPFDMKAADANGDGDISVMDVVNVVDIILHGGLSKAPARMMAISRSDNYDGSLYIAPFAIACGGEAEVEVMLDTPDYDATALQLCVTLPEGLSIRSAEPTDRVSTNHNVAMAQQDGVYTLVCYSSSNAEFSERDGAVLRLPIVASPNFNGGQLRVSGIEVSDTKGTPHRLGATTVDVAAISGIADVLVGADQVSYYSISGMRLPQPPASGPYIELRGTQAEVKTNN